MDKQEDRLIKLIVLLVLFQLTGSVDIDSYRELLTYIL